MIRGRKELAKHWYPRQQEETDDKWLERALKALERVVTKHRATFNNPDVPGYIKDGWARRLPKNRFGEYEMTEQQADIYYNEHVNPPRGDYMPRNEQGRVIRTQS